MLFEQQHEKMLHKLSPTCLFVVNIGFFFLCTFDVLKQNSMNSMMGNLLFNIKIVINNKKCSFALRFNYMKQIHFECQRHLLVE